MAALVLVVVGNFLGVDVAIYAEEPVEDFQDAKACQTKDSVPDADRVCRLDGWVEEVFKGGFNDGHLVEVFLTLWCWHSTWQCSFLPARVG